MMNASQSHQGCLSLLVFVFIVVVRLRSSMAGLEKENSVAELSTRADMVDMAGYGEEKLSSVLVTGSVFCEASMDGYSKLHALPVSGAEIAVACNSRRQNMKQDSAKARTDEYGDFIVDLPSHLHAIPNLEKACTLRVLGLPTRSPCNWVFVMKPKGIRLASVGNGIRTYTTGTITLHQPQISQLRT